MSARARMWTDAALVLIIIAGLASVYGLSRLLEAERPADNPFLSYEEFYVSPETARRMSLGFNGLVADWYWMRSLQYVGRKMDVYKGDIQIDDLKPLGVERLAPLLEHATTLDPRFMAAYEYGAIVLPAIDVEAALRLTRKGIEANPQSWRLRQHLGYIYWQQGRYAEASEAYRSGAALPGAPGWMNAMAAQMEVSGGSRETARDIYRRMYAEADEEQIKQLAFKRLQQLQSFDERDVLRRVLENYRTRSLGRCPASWRETAAAVRAAGLRTDASGAPLDPSGTPYVLDSATCDARLDARSPVPQK